MLAELILTYAVSSSFPAVIREAGPSYLKEETRLHVRSELTQTISLDIQPYVWIDQGHTPSAAGAELELAYDFGNGSVGYYHHSAHALDRNNIGEQFDGIRIRIKMGE